MAEANLSRHNIKKRIAIAAAMSLGGISMMLAGCGGEHTILDSTSNRQKERKFQVYRSSIQHKRLQHIATTIGRIIRPESQITSTIVIKKTTESKHEHAERGLVGITSQHYTYSQKHISTAPPEITTRLMPCSDTNISDTATFNRMTTAGIEDAKEWHIRLSLCGLDGLSYDRESTRGGSTTPHYEHIPPEAKTPCDKVITAGMQTLHAVSPHDLGDLVTERVNLCTLNSEGVIFHLMG